MALARTDFSPCCELIDVARMHAGKVIAQSLGFIDMGAMLCKASPDDSAKCYGLTQLLVPGLEQRAWQLPPLMGVPASRGDPSVLSALHLLRRPDGRSSLSSF